MNETRCPLCGAYVSKEFLSGSYWSDVEKRYLPWPLWKCSVCSFAWVPRAADFDLTKLHSESTFYSTQVWKAERPDPLSGLLSNALNEFKKTEFRGKRGLRPPAHLLEIGAGSGDFLKVLRKLGFDIEGTELDERHAKRLTKEGILLHTGAFEELQLQCRGYDAVIMFEVIEHMRDPVAVLRKAANLLGPEGRIILSTPNLDSVRASIEKQNWTGIHAPFHVTLFTPQSLSLATKTANLRIQRLYTRTTFLGTILGIIGGYVRLMSKKHGRRPPLPSQFLEYAKERVWWLSVALLLAILSGVIVVLFEVFSDEGSTIVAVIEK